MQGCSKGKRPITDLFLPLRMTKSHRSCRRRLAVISLVKKTLIIIIIIIIIIKFFNRSCRATDINIPPLFSHGVNLVFNLTSIITDSGTV